MDKYKKTYYKTADDVLKRIYSNQIRNSKQRGHDLPNYSLAQFMNWSYLQQRFWDQYEKWVESGFDKWEKPSVDRIDESVSYRFDNIRFLSWKENWKRSAKNNLSKNASFETKVKAAKSISKPVSQYQKDGTFIGSYQSIMDASRKTNISFRHISECANEKLKSAGGYIWRFTP